MCRYQMHLKRLWTDCWTLRTNYGAPRTPQWVPRASSEICGEVCVRWLVGWMVSWDMCSSVWDDWLDGWWVEICFKCVRSRLDGWWVGICVEVSEMSGWMDGGLRYALKCVRCLVGWVVGRDMFWSAVRSLVGWMVVWDMFSGCLFRVTTHF